MFINLRQVRRSIEALSSVHPFYGIAFLSLKKASLPIGDTVGGLNFTSIVNDVLFRYYKPLPNHEGFYSPFLTSNKSNRWQDKRYASTTLQRITVDTFGEAFIHPKGTQTWGWRKNYIDILEKYLPDRKIPAFDLAVWLFRQDVWPQNVQYEDLIRSLFNLFDINKEESDALFDLWQPQRPLDWLQDEPVSDSGILEVIGYPANAKLFNGAILQSLELVEIGPATRFIYEPSERLNIITGDNSLGKSFLFDGIWWALTNTWVDDPLRPRPDAQLKIPRISSEVKIINENHIRTQKVTVQYDWKYQKWKEPKVKIIEAGLAIYARYDGSFAIWDSTLRDFEVKNDISNNPQLIILGRNDIWNGLQGPDRKSWLCNGLIRDWVSWQLSGPRYEREWSSLKSCLQKLSPSGESLAAGKPIRVKIDDAREIPTIIMPYGPVPLTHASAGVQRILALAYTLVWAWFRHLSNNEIMRQEPQQNLVLLVDEVEAHLHPRWQRTIVPALINAIESLSTLISPQIHLATHSPMVMASAETIFDEKRDDFHHLRLEDREVILEELPFHKRGSADRWLMSEAFELGLPTSLPVEQAIRDALDLQLAENVTSEQVISIDNRLKANLGETDDFWPRWTFFAKKYGIYD